MKNIFFNEPFLPIVRFFVRFFVFMIGTFVVTTRTISSLESKQQISLERLMLSNVVPIQIDIANPRTCYVLHGVGTHGFLQQCEKCTLKCFIFDCVNIHSVLNFKRIIDSAWFTLTIGGQDIVTYYLSLLSELNEIEQSNDQFTVQIPSSFTMPSINLFLLENHDVKINMNVPYSSSIANIRLIVEVDNEPEDVEDRDVFFQRMELVGQISTTCNIINITRDYRSQQPKGFFIEGNFENVDSVVLEIEGRAQFTFDDVTSRHHCHKISDNLHFVSFASENDYQSLNRTNISGAIPFFENALSAWMHCRLRPSSLCNATSVKIHMLYCNILRYQSGMAGLYSGLISETVPRDPRSIPDMWRCEIGECVSSSMLCSITLTMITDLYAKCDKCQNTYDYESLRRWLRSNSTCPLCRSTWTNEIKFTVPNK